MILTHHGMNSILRAKGPSYGSVVIGDKTYRTVIIGNQEWTVENLDWAWAGLDVGSSGTTSETPKANYYSDNERTYGWNGRKCGLLYNWPAVHYLDVNSDVMLPDGWRVATYEDWRTLRNAVGGDSEAKVKLKAKDRSQMGNWPVGWGGTDDYGFSVLPSGFRRSGSEDVGKQGIYWSSTDYNQVMANGFFFSIDDAGTYSTNKYVELSVRLVRDYPPRVTIGDRSYKTVLMPDGKVWLAENLDWKFAGLTFRDGSAGNEMTTDASFPQATYYDYDESTYGAEGNKYGLLYNWTAADYINNHLIELGIPEGWHVATYSDWRELKYAIGREGGATKVKSTTGWNNDGNGTDEFGFNIVPAGKGYYYNAESRWVFTGLGNHCTIWTPDTNDLEDGAATEEQINAASTNLNMGKTGTAGFYVVYVLRLVYTPPTELNLPVRTIRLKMVDNTVNPTECDFNGTWTRVEGTDDTWDCHYDNAYWSNLFGESSNTNRSKILECLGANVSSVSWLNQLFYNCTSLRHLSLFDTKNITSMHEMFRKCSKLKTIPAFNTRSVTDFGQMFANCNELEYIPSLDTSSLTDAYGMFIECNKLKSIPYFNTSRASDLGWMFYRCYKLEKIPPLDTSSNTNMLRMFGDCTSLRTIPLLDTSNVTSMASAFYSTKISTIPKFNTSNVTSMYDAFDHCTLLEELPELDTSKVTNMESAFNYCTSLRTIPLLDTSNVTNFRRTFTSCTSLVSIPEIDTSSATDVRSMFSGCSSLTRIHSFDISNANDLSGLFSGCSSLEQIPFFNTSHVVNMESMLSGCSSITEVPLFDTSNVTSMRSMLYSCSGITEVPLFNTSKVTNMLNMLACTNITSVPQFDTSNVTSMQGMFDSCKELLEVPLFDTSNVTDMMLMFRYCEQLTSIPLFNTSSATYVEAMFMNCKRVQSGALALYQQMSTQTSPPTSYSSCFRECGSYTTTGQAELAQIPTSWGGTMSA